MIDENKDFEDIRSQLVREGYKFSYQRHQIVKAIYGNGVHINVDEIYNKVKNKDVSRTTLYRNLRLLEEVGVLKKINISNINYYELEKAGNNKLHVHAKCVKCNKIIDISEDAISESLHGLVEKLNENQSITVSSTSVVLSGICKECELNSKLECI